MPPPPPRPILTPSVHFGTRFHHESLAESIVRHEYFLAARLGLKEGMRVIDVGCGVGGPARNISRFSGAQITGLNNNDYQVSRGNAKCAKEGIASHVKLVKGDFMALPFSEGTFDGAYAIEATCHAPDRTKCFAQIFKVLKPGGVFGGYEWVTTDAYEPGNPVHRDIKHGIEIGDGLPDITPWTGVLDALRGAGFVVEEYRDLAPTSQVPWYAGFLPSYNSLKGFQLTPIGMTLTHIAVRIMQLVGIAPKGTAEMHSHLIEGERGGGVVAGVPGVEGRGSDRARRFVSFAACSLYAPPLSPSLLQARARCVLAASWASSPPCSTSRPASPRTASLRGTPTRRPCAATPSPRLPATAAPARAAAAAAAGKGAGLQLQVFQPGWRGGGARSSGDG
jgi:sterol 24-C-methyltransferase